MLEECEKISQMQGEVEVDESYFGPRRMHGKRGRGAIKKTPVFGMLKRNGYIHTQIVKDCSADELMPIIKDLSNLPQTEYYSDYWGAYDGLVDYGAKAHYRVKHSKNEFAIGNNHINGIESFWAYTKLRLSKFKGITKNNFILYLKESEFRYNIKLKNEDLYKNLLKLIRKNPLKVFMSL